MAADGDLTAEAVRTGHLFRLQKFAGGPSDEFEREVEIGLALSPMPENAACVYVLNALEGPARRRVLMFPHDMIDTPEKILDILREAYGERRDAIDIVASFYNRRQQSKEAVIEYAATLRNLQAKANRLLSDAISSTHLATRFVKGLRNSQVRRETSRQLADHGSSFADLLKTARRVEREEMCNDREDEIDRLTARVRQLEMEAASRLHTTQQRDFPFEADRQHKQKCMRRQQTRQRSGQRPATPHDSDGGGGRRRGFCRWFNVAKGWGFITPDNGDQDVFVHHSVIHKAGFRSLGKGEVVEFEPRLSYKGVEATFVCGIGGVKCRGSDRRPISKKKFQNKPVVQLQQRQPQRRQSQAELQRDRFHGRSGRSTCNISSRPVDDSAVYTVRPLVDGPALTLNSDNRAAKSSLQLEDIQLPETQNCQDYDSDEETPFWYGTLPPHQARTRLIPKVTVPVVPEVTVCAVPDMTVPKLTVPVVSEMTVSVVPDMTVSVIPEGTVPAVFQPRFAVRQA
ncbi:uncharacterized protein LOC112556012 [Pomacea canaliculata]|uniref:uncharacterized protein LOC112556012 n=1 Tax=Pomacea canaliculata TaxID=400727 RepID=UPI000D72F9F8|nr:uncharacterized protein LOC112556012 [Pomacea canaliculata]